MLKCVQVFQYSYPTLFFFVGSCKTEALYLCAFYSILVWFQTKAEIPFGG